MWLFVITRHWGLLKCTKIDIKKAWMTSWSCSSDCILEEFLHILPVFLGDFEQMSLNILFSASVPDLEHVWFAVEKESCKTKIAQILTGKAICQIPSQYIILHRIW